MLGGKIRKCPFSRVQSGKITVWHEGKENVCNRVFIIYNFKTLNNTGNEALSIRVPFRSKQLMSKPVLGVQGIVQHKTLLS